MKTFYIASIATVLLALVGVIFFGGDGLITAKEELNTSANLLASAKPLAIEGKAPDLRGIEGWVNSEPLSQEDLRGKVVLVDFWTYSCINCIRTFPYISSWHEKYKDNNFVLLGVHTPEFDFEKSKANVIEATKKYDLNYPIALDNNYETWRAFNNQYWPAHYLIDVDGNVRYRHFGEGAYSETEAAIQQLLLEAGYLELSDIVDSMPSPVTRSGSVATPEIYLGYNRINNFGNQEKNIPIGESFNFSPPAIIAPNNFYLEGKWNIGPEEAMFGGGNGKIIIHYKASKLNMVLASSAPNGSLVSLILDGKSLDKNNKGGDVTIENGRAFSKIQEPQLYNLVDTGSSYDWHILEIVPEDANLQAFTFTFG